MITRHIAWAVLNLTTLLVSTASPAQTIPGKLTVLRSFPHNVKNWTEGLAYAQGKLYEGTGLIGDTRVEVINPQTGESLKTVSIPNFYGEGLTVFNQQIFQLTYTNQMGFIYDLENLIVSGQFQFRTQTGEAWGLAHTDQQLIMSDGSARLYFLNPKDGNVENTLDVSDENGPVTMLNELEYVNGIVYANIWETNEIVAIELQNGHVVARFDGSPLQTAAGARYPYLNGIAYNSDTKTFYLTGKNFKKSFEVTLKY